MSIPTPLLPVSPTTTLTTPQSPPVPSSPATTTTTGTFSQTLSNLGLGYGIAIALGFLVLLSSLLLSSYLCIRRNRRHLTTAAPPPLTSTPDGGVILPRIIFVAEDDDGEEDTNRNGNSSSSPGVVGLSKEVINSYPKFQFAKSDGNDSNSSTCSICFCEFREGEMLRTMPDCNHSFHLLCLDAWLRLNGSCPVCRNSPLPTPLSTPLAEVVPLAQYPDNRRRRS